MLTVQEQREILLKILPNESCYIEKEGRQSAKLYYDDSMLSYAYWHDPDELDHLRNSK